MVLKDKKTKITFHNGILTIGGTIIEIVYEDSHIFFDFGVDVVYMIYMIYSSLFLAFFGKE